MVQKQSNKQNVNVKVHIGRPFGTSLGRGVDVKKKRKYKRKAKQSKKHYQQNDFQQSYIQPYHPVYIQSGNPYNNEANSNPLLKAIEELTNKIKINYHEPQPVNTLLGTIQNQPHYIQRPIEQLHSVPRGNDLENEFDDSTNQSSIDEPENQNSDESGFAFSPSLTNLDFKLREIKSAFHRPTEEEIIQHPFSNPRHVIDGYYNLPDGTISRFESPPNIYEREHPLLVEHSQSMKRAGGGTGYDNETGEMETENIGSVRPITYVTSPEPYIPRRGRPPKLKSMEQELAIQRQKEVEREVARQQREAVKEAARQQKEEKDRIRKEAQKERQRLTNERINQQKHSKERKKLTGDIEIIGEPIEAKGAKYEKRRK